MLTIANNTITATFETWDSDTYDLFLRSKKLPEYNLDYDWQHDTYRLTTPARFAHIFGIEAEITDRGWLPFSAHLFDYQTAFTRIALNAKRFAHWWDTGLGKTHTQLEWVRQVNHRTGGKVLMVIPLNIIQQTLDIRAEYFNPYPEIIRLDTREDLRTWCIDGIPNIGVTNPEKFIPRNGEPEVISEIRHCAGVVLDEASLLKSGGGKIKWALIKSCRGIEYKLSLTATPAPNDTMEYASQGSFLEKLRNEGEILWTYFTRDKEGNWKVKKHAEQAFFRFMAGWSVYLRNPKHYGFADNLKDLPPPEIQEYKLELTEEQRRLVMAIPDPDGQLSIFGSKQKLAMMERSKYSQVAKGFIYRGEGQKPERIASIKPGFVAELIRQEVAAGLQVLVWTIFDEESTILDELMEGSNFSAEVLTGKMKQSDRIEIIEAFRNGHLQVLISKASLIGFGLNFQMCGSMIFSGLNDSWEQMYQAIRRAYRYGQKRSVRVHIPYIPELEGVVYRNVQQKQARFDSETKLQELNYLAAMKGILDAA